MRYLGGKARISDWVVASLLRVKGSRSNYVEPFLGSAAVFEKAARHFETSQAYDLHPDLILMWQALVAGWKPPLGITRSDYERLRKESPSPLRGLVGFGASFGGKWFAGYESCPMDASIGKMRPSFYVTARNAVRRTAIEMSRANTIECLDYRDVPIPPNSLVYCDPPYADTQGYDGLPPFDSAAFWRTASRWAGDGALVIVSEGHGPSDWAILAERERKAMMRVVRHEENEMRVERLYMKGTLLA